MRLSFRYFSLLLLLIGLISWTSCDIGGSGDDEKDADFDRVQMLENYGNNIIIPSYQAFQDSVDQLKSAADNFAANTSESNLEKFQKELKGARQAWQHVGLYNFGPAGNNLLRTSLNTYPTDTAKIEKNIDSGDYTLGSVSNQDAVGFPAAGYLIYGIGDNKAEIIAAYTDSADASDRLQYLSDNISFIKNKTDEVVNEWQSDGGDYIGMFLSKENAGTDVGSSLGMMINAMVQHYERFIRDGKLGIPSGVRSAGVPRPEATEAYYAGYSKDLAVRSLQTIRKFYRGEDRNGNDGLGLQENLEALDAAKLNSEIQTELNGAIEDVKGLDSPLTEQIRNDKSRVEQAFKEAQDLLPLFKTDMTSVLGVTITYQDSDGD